jgi:DNA-binding CsgD family transcriptional regulator
LIGAAVLCAEFIGRAGELAHLLERYRAAVEGTASAVLVSGDAGFGKTRLVSELRASTKTSGAFFAGGACLEYAQSPLGPFVDVLDELVAAESHVLATHPNVDAVLSIGDKRRQFSAIADIMRDFSLTRPCIIVIEDIHWADYATLELLRFLLEKISAQRLLLVLTYRSDELHRNHPLRQLLGRISRLGAVSHIALEPLSAEEIDAVIKCALKERKPLDFEMRLEVRTLAEGNPFLAEELLRSVTEASAGSYGRPKLSGSVREVILERLSLMKESDQRILTYGALLGRDFDLDLLATLSCCSIEQVKNALRRGCELQLLEEHSTREVRYSFRHALAREALRDELLADELRMLHQQIADQLERRPAASVSELGYHFWAARDLAKTLRYNEEAGDLAVARCAFDDAVLSYKRAICYLDEPSRQRAEIFAKLGEAAYCAAFFKDARYFERALADCEQLDDAEAAAHLCQRIAHCYYFAEDGPKAIEWGLRAVEAVRSAPHSTRYSEVLAFAAKQFSIIGDAHRTREYLDEAVQHGEITEGYARVWYHEARGLTASHLGCVKEAIQNLRNAVAAVQEDDVNSMVTTRVNLGYEALELAQNETALDVLEDLQIVAQKKMPAHRFFALGLLADAHLRLGNYGESLRYFEEALASGTVQLDGFTMSTFTTLAILLGQRCSKPDLVDRFATEHALESAMNTLSSDYIGKVVAAFVEMLLDAGRIGEARRLIRRGLEALHCGGPAAWLLVLAAEHGEASQVPRARELLEAWAGGGENTIGLAHVALFDAYVARSRRNAEAASAHADLAASIFATLTRPYEEARALEVLGDPMRAHAIYERIGDLRDAARLRAVFVNRRGRGKNELTDREKEIYRLLLTGKSNRAIADALVISERTAEKHVQVILGKLNAHSRMELAARRDGNSTPVEVAPNA